MNRTTTYYSLSVPSSSFLSGLDTVVISEVNLIVRVCLSMIYEIGRRHLMLIHLGYFLSLSMKEYGFFGQASSVFNLFIKSAFIVIQTIRRSTLIRLFILKKLPYKQRVKTQSFISVFPRKVAIAITLFGTSMINYLGPRKIFSNFLIPYDFTAADSALYHARDQDRITRMFSVGIYNNLNSTYI